MARLFVTETSGIVPNDHEMVWGIKEKGSLMKTEYEVSAVDARYYFATRELGLSWYNYDDFKELSELRRTTTVIGHLPMRLVILLAGDAAEVRLAAQKRSSIYFFEPGEFETRC